MEVYILNVSLNGNKFAQHTILKLGLELTCKLDSVMQIPKFNLVVSAVIIFIFALQYV